MSPSGQAESHGLVDVNTCTVEDLEQVTGVCRDTAKAIVGARKRQGGFSCLEDLGDVPSVGPSLLESLQLCLTCGPKDKTRHGSRGSSYGSREELVGETPSSVHRLLSSEGTPSGNSHGSLDDEDPGERGQDAIADERDATAVRKRDGPRTASKKLCGQEVAPESSRPSPAVLEDADSPPSEKHELPSTRRSRHPSTLVQPPQLGVWLNTFRSWSHVERPCPLDHLIEKCESGEVRHMLHVIESQLPRDFISLLPKELALYVLSFLEPRDLLSAAQTCRYWRILVEDNLIWWEKCCEAGLEDVMEVLGRRVAPPPSTVNLPPPTPWKLIFMRHHNVTMNWRCNPVREPQVLRGHEDHVITCLQFSGNRIVSGSNDSTLKVWSANSGRYLRTLVGHTGGVWSSQMAGSLVVSGSTDCTLRVWNADTGQCFHTLYGHTSTVKCMHLCANQVVSGSRDASLRVWNLETGECLHVLIGHVAAVRCVQYNGRLVVSGSFDYMVKVWDPLREECLHTLQGHTDRVYSLQFDGVHVVSGSLDASIRVWNVKTGVCRHQLMGHESLTTCMELRNNILVSGNADSTVKVWDILTGQCLKTLTGAHKHQSLVTCLQFNSRFVVTSSVDGTVKLWDLRTGEFLRNLVALDTGCSSGSGGVVWRLRATPTKLVCAVGSRNGTEDTKLLVLDFDKLI